MSSLLARSKCRITIGAHNRVTSVVGSGLSIPLNRAFKSATRQDGLAATYRDVIPNYTPEDLISVSNSTADTVTKTPFRPRFIVPAARTTKIDEAQPQQLSVSQDAIEQNTTTENISTIADHTSIVPVYHRGAKFDRVPYWRTVSRWKDVTEEKFLSYRWQVSRTQLLYHQR